MNIRDLQYLVAVADHRQFARAAAACHVSQPSLSMQIKKLEGELGTIIFERTNKQFFITPAGTAIINKARIILREVDEMKTIGKTASDPFAGTFRLGVIPTSAPYLLPDFLPLLKQSFPQLAITVTESQTALLIESLQQGSIDAAVLALPVEHKPFKSAALYDEPFYLAIPPGHPLENRNNVSPYDLRGEEILLLEDGHCLRDQAFAICHQGNATEQTNFRASSLETLRHIIATGSGMTLMPERAIKPDDGVRYIPFKEPSFKRTMGLVWRSSSPQKPLIEKIIALSRSLS